MRAHRCVCGQPLFFGNSQCLACGRAIGYDAQRGALVALRESAEVGVWQADDGSEWRWRRCSQFDTASGCNWLIDAADANAANGHARCRCCRLLRHVADLSLPGHATWFNAIEQARRRLVARLIALELPLRSRSGEDPQQGLAFDLPSSAVGAAVTTGHADGVITLDLTEADDATREARRTALGEPYRTLLGHLRHESGHYYWQRLIEPQPTVLDAWRELFGDERMPYTEALQSHYANGPAADWNSRFVSAYASAHPWEDWAETWAHYLHVIDTLETGHALGLRGEQVRLSFTPFDAQALGGEQTEAESFSALLRGWMELAGALNELCRSMGVADFYPFVLSLAAARKLYFVHRLVQAQRRGEGSDGARR